MLPKDASDEFRREADVLIHRLRIGGKLDALRSVLTRLLPTVNGMSPGDTGHCLVGEDAAETRLLR